MRGVTGSSLGGSPSRGQPRHKIVADYARGVLTVKVEFPEEEAPAEPKKIPVGVKEP